VISSQSRNMDGRSRFVGRVWVVKRGGRRRREVGEGEGWRIGVGGSAEIEVVVEEMMLRVWPVLGSGEGE